MLQPRYTILDDWIAREAIACWLDSTPTLDAAVDRVVASLGSAVDLLGFGEALHGGEEILILRNRLFERLVEAHGYCAIAVESSFPRSRVVNAYVTGGDTPVEPVLEAGFSHGFGRLVANRELIEWMRQYNADPRHATKLHFYGFDMPGVMGGPASPREMLNFVLDHLASVGQAAAERHRDRIEPLLGQDADWENPMPWRDPAKMKDLLAMLNALRIATEELISDLHAGRPQWLAASGADHYTEAMHYASIARQFLNFFSALALGPTYAESLGVRDALMADNLAYIVERERPRGKVFVFAHNKHLQRGQAQWQLGPQVNAWWPAGAHVAHMLGSRYAVIGSAVGVSDANGIAQPEAGTLEASLTASPGPVRFLPTHRGQALPAETIAALPTRSGSTRNGSYFPLNSQSFTDFDWLVALDSTTYNRGGPPLDR
jgi:erythromycin esterase-like protein